MPSKPPPRKSALVQKRTSVSQTTGVTTDNDHEAEAGVDRDTGGDMDMDLDTGGNLREMEESLKKSMATAVGLRKGQKQQRLEKDFEIESRTIEDQIDERLKEHQQDRARVQEDHLTRLLTLSQRKADVEDQIIKHTRELANAYVAVQAEFGAVLRGRSEDVQEAIEALSKMEDHASST